MAMLDKVKVEEIATRWAPAFTPVQRDLYTAQVDMFCDHTGLSPWQLVTVGGWLCAHANAAGEDASPVVRSLVASCAIRAVERGFG